MKLEMNGSLSKGYPSYAVYAKIKSSFLGWGLKRTNSKESWCLTCIGIGLHPTINPLHKFPYLLVEYLHQLGNVA